MNQKFLFASYSKGNILQIVPADAQNVADASKKAAEQALKDNRPILVYELRSVFTPVTEVKEETFN